MANFKWVSKIRIMLELLPMPVGSENMMYNDCKIVHHLNVLECI